MHRHRLGRIPWRPALALIASALLWTCCTTSPASLPLPPLDWPTFPDPVGRVTLVDETVTMPLDYWLAVARYAVDADAVRQIVEAWRAAAGE